MSDCRHLILGGTGFIGRHVALLLARAGHRITVASRTPPGFAFPGDVAARIAWRPMDLAAPDWDRLTDDADVVHHYAWTSIPAEAEANQSDDLRMNVGATIGLLDALQRRGSGRVVFASSGGTVYGAQRGAPANEDHPLAPVTAYGIAKAAAERCMQRYRVMGGLDCRIARIANPYGAGQSTARGLGAVTTFLDHALNGRRIVIWGDGRIVRDYVHISDVAACLAALACAPRTDAHVFNIGSGIGTSLNEIITQLEHRLGRRIAVSRTMPRSFDVPVSVLAIDRARHRLRWSPRLSLQAGLVRTMADLTAGRALSTLDAWQPVRSAAMYAITDTA
jgi:UDP-glucose 4-epimerase